MLFAAWCIIWIVNGQTALSLVFPIIATVIRAAYHRNLKLVTGTSIVVAAFVYLMYSITPGKSAAEAARGAMMVLAWAVLVTHLAATYSGMRKDRLPLAVAMYLHQYPRCVRIVKERWDDFLYSLTSRTNGSDLRFFQKPRVYGLAVFNFFAELVRVEGQLELIVTARGQFPHPKEFETALPGSRSVLVGDSLLLLIAIVFVSIGPDRAVPDVILLWLRPIRTVLAKM